MSAIKVVVNFADKPSYDVRIGQDIMAGLGRHVAALSDAGSVLIITDSNVGPLYLGAARESCKQAGLRIRDITVPAGESSKSVQFLYDIWEAMADSRLGRDCVVVALGGGVVGDLAGFAAATYMRGVPFVQVPTTLLAMVDSSVGGKTAVNLQAGKNLAGAFYQPSYVCADTRTLSTLDGREWACGCAEMAKSAFLDSDEFFFWLSSAAEAGSIDERDAEVVQEAIARCVTFKADIVAADEREAGGGVRELLNYGHTLGHAIEKLAGYGVYSHGAAVAEGMRFAARLGVQLEGFDRDAVTAQDDLLDALGLPALDFRAPADDMLDAMMGDKKVRSGHLRFVLPRDVGNCVVRSVDTETVLEHLRAWERAQ